MSSNEETRLLSLENRVYQLDSVLSGLEGVRVAGLEQKLNQSWTLGDQSNQPGLINFTAWSETGPFAGVTIKIYSFPGGTLVATGITDGLGFVGFQLPGGVSYGYEITGPSGSLTFSPTSGALNIQNYPAGTQTFYDLLIYSTATTFTLNNSVWGTATLAWNAGQLAWIASASISVPVCAGTGCAAATVTHRYHLYSYGAARGQSFQLSEDWPAITSIVPCPNPAGTVGNGAVIWTQDSLSLPSLSLAAHVPASDPKGQYLYCTASPTVTITQP